MPGANPIPVALIGYGLSFHIFHIPFIASLLDTYTLRAIVQRHPTPSKNASKDYPDAKVYTSTAAMLAAEPSVELVVITSIPSTHFALCQEILNAGKHVVCEKPFVATSGEAVELAELAVKKSLTLSVYQNRRWDSDFLSLKYAVNSQALGRIVEAESHFDRHRPWPGPSTSWKAQEPTGGALYDLGSHLLDQLVNLFGIPDKITAFVGDQRVYDEQDPAGGSAAGDSFTVHLHYENSVAAEGKLLATARAAVVSAERNQLRWWVRGTEGTFRKLDLDVQEDQLKAGRRPPGFNGDVFYGDKRTGVKGDEDFGVESPHAAASVTSVDTETNAISEKSIAPEIPAVTYARFYELLAKSIRGGDDSPVSAIEAARVIRLIELAMISSREERTVKVDINW